MEGGVGDDLSHFLDLEGPLGLCAEDLQGLGVPENLEVGHALLICKGMIRNNFAFLLS